MTIPPPWSRANRRCVRLAGSSVGLIGKNDRARRATMTTSTNLFSIQDR